MPYINQAGGSGLGAVVVSGAAAANKVLQASSATAASWVFPPGYEINYTQITSNANITDTSEATATALISPGAITFDGGPVLLHFFGWVAPPTFSASSSVILSLFEGATQITRLAFFHADVTSPQNTLTVSAFYRFTPTAASHTYKITGVVDNTTGTPAIIAGSGGTGGNPPAFVRFTKV